MAALAARRSPRTTIAAVASGAIAQYALVGDRWHALVVTALGIALGSFASRRAVRPVGVAAQAAKAIAGSSAASTAPDAASNSSTG